MLDALVASTLTVKWMRVQEGSSSQSHLSLTFIVDAAHIHRKCVATTAYSFSCAPLFSWKSKEKSWHEEALLCFCKPPPPPKSCLATTSGDTEFQLSTSPSNREDFLSVVRGGSMRETRAVQEDSSIEYKQHQIRCTLTDLCNSSF